MKPKLAILIYSLGGGGAERVLITLLPSLKEYFTLTLFVLENKNHYDANVTCEVIGDSKSDESPIKKLLDLPFLAHKYAKRLKEEQINLSFSLLNRPNYINILASKLNPSLIPIISEHATPSMQYKGSSWGAKANRFLIKTLYPYARHIITVSNGVKNDLIQSFNIKQEQITAIYNPFNLDSIKNSSIDHFERLDTLNTIKQVRPIWVSIGRLDTGKNHAFLIRAMKQLKIIFKENTPLLLILGEGEQLQNLQALILEEDVGDCVCLEGFVKNPYAYIKLAQITLSSSLYEGFLNVLVESLALGIPPISSDCPNGPREILMSATPTYNDQTEITPYGILFPISSSSSLNEEECLRILVDTLIKIIHQEITFDQVLLQKRSQDFDHHAIAQSYIQLLQKVSCESKVPL